MFDSLWADTSTGIFIFRKLLISSLLKVEMVRVVVAGCVSSTIMRVNTSNVGTDFRRLNLTSLDVRF